MNLLVPIRFMFGLDEPYCSKTSTTSAVLVNGAELPSNAVSCLL